MRINTALQIRISLCDGFGVWCHVDPTSPQVPGVLAPGSRCSALCTGSLSGRGPPRVQQRLPLQGWQGCWCRGEERLLRASSLPVEHTAGARARARLLGSSQAPSLCLGSLLCEVGYSMMAKPDLGVKCSDKDVMVRDQGLGGVRSAPLSQPLSRKPD